VSGSKVIFGDVDSKILVARVCHEIGNLLAAIRLSGYVLTMDEGAGQQVRATAEEIEGLAVHAAALMHLLPPVLALHEEECRGVEPRVVRDALSRSLPSHLFAAIEFEEPKESETPSLWLRSQEFCNVLVALVIASRGASQGKGRLRISFRRQAEAAQVVIEDRTGSLLEEELEVAALRGVALVLALAEFLLHPIGGGISVDRACFAGKGTRVALVLPAAPRGV